MRWHISGVKCVSLILNVFVFFPQHFFFFFSNAFFRVRLCGFLFFFLRRENILYERLFGSHLTPCLWKHIDHVLALKCRVLPASLHLSDKQVGTLGPGSAVKNLLIGRWVVCFVLFFLVSKLLPSCGVPRILQREPLTKQTQCFSCSHVASEWSHCYRRENERKFQRQCECKRRRRRRRKNPVPAQNQDQPVCSVTVLLSSRVLHVVKCLGFARWGDLPGTPVYQTRHLQGFVFLYNWQECSFIY